MVQAKKLKYKPDYVNNQNSILTGTLVWRGTLAERLFDLYIIIMRVLGAADWNKLDPELAERLSKACAQEANRFYYSNCVYRLFFTTSELMEFTYRESISATEFVECMEQYVAHILPSEDERIYKEYISDRFAEVTSSLKCLAMYSVIASIAVLDEPFTIQCAELVDEWMEKKITDDEFSEMISGKIDGLKKLMFRE